MKKILSIILLLYTQQVFGQNLPLVKEVDNELTTLVKGKKDGRTILFYKGVPYLENRRSVIFLQSAQIVDQPDQQQVVILIDSAYWATIGCSVQDLEYKRSIFVQNSKREWVLVYSCWDKDDQESKIINASIKGTYLKVKHKKVNGEVHFDQVPL